MSNPQTLEHTYLCIYRSADYGSGEGNDYDVDTVVAKDRDAAEAALVTGLDLNLDEPTDIVAILLPHQAEALIKTLPIVGYITDCVWGFSYVTNELVIAGYGADLDVEEVAEDRSIDPEWKDRCSHYFNLFQMTPVLMNLRAALADLE